MVAIIGFPRVKKSQSSCPLCHIGLLVHGGGGCGSRWSVPLEGRGRRVGVCRGGSGPRRWVSAVVREGALAVQDPSPAVTQVSAVIQHQDTHYRLTQHMYRQP